MSSNQAPAEGERRAVLGFSSQYRVSAHLILMAIRTLQWIRVADPEAGRVDDLQIGTPNRVDAFQIKWSTYGGTFTFTDLATGTADRPCLIAQLAQGWMQLRQNYPGHRIVVHLVTNRHPSIHDEPPVLAAQPAPKPRHSAAFLAQAWNPIHESVGDTDTIIPAVWQQAWLEIQAASGLSPADFKAFVRDCELELDFHLPTPSPHSSREDAAYFDDHDNLAELLPRIVASPQRVIELSRDKLLQRLGWSDRLLPRSTHVFPAPHIPYQPIQITIERLHHAIDSLPGGYIAVLGSPGSGKSTLLSQALRTGPERVIHYYAYVPDAPSPLVLRGESVNFLHDIVLSLDNSGFAVGSGLPGYDRDLLLDYFHRQLNRLHQDYTDHGRKTLIVVDGLDHIAREQHPDRSLLQDLPQPDQIPDGVYLVLGSQTDNPFPDSVQAVVQETSRRIEMDSLNRDDIFRIVSAAKLKVQVSGDQMDYMYNLSCGHPLALGILLNRLMKAPASEDVDVLLSSAEPFKGSIERQYHSYWKQFETDTALKELIGQISRLRGAIDMLWVQTWADPEALDRLRFHFAHYFAIYAHDRWTFFHNSFRLFLLEKTSESRPGHPDPNRDHAHHQHLAQRCAEAANHPRQTWETLYHLYSASDHASVLEYATPQKFREQLLSFRPMDAVREDIGLALRSAAHLQDPLAFVRLILAGSEIAERGAYLGEGVLAPFLLAIGEDKIALEHIRSGRRLRIQSTAALRISIRLVERAYHDEARRVFELGVPQIILTATNTVEHDTQNFVAQHLEIWAQTAIHFIEIQQVLETINRIRYAGDEFIWLDEETATRLLRSKLLHRVGSALLEAARWEDLAVLESSFHLELEPDRYHWLRLQAESWKKCRKLNDLTRAREYLQKTLGIISDWDLNEQEQLEVAEGVFLITGDKTGTREWLSELRQPPLAADLNAPDSGLEAFVQRLRLNRLLYALGSSQSPAEIVPAAANQDLEGLVLFERAVCKIARLEGLAWRGECFDGPAIDREITPILRIFNISWRKKYDWTRWYVVDNAQGEFYSWLIEAVARHGAEAVESLRQAFHREWIDPATAQYWRPDVRREVILSLYPAGVDQDWLMGELRTIESKMYQDKDPDGRVDTCHAQINAWLAMGRKDDARRLMVDLLRTSFGAGFRKDYQLDDWIKWLGHVNDAEPASAADRIAWMARAIVAFAEYAESRPVNSAANALLKVAFRWSPRRAVILFHWFIEKGVIWHEEGCCTLLKAALNYDKQSAPLVVAALFELLLPTLSRMHGDLAEAILSAVYEILGSTETLRIARYMLGRVEVYALPSTREDWRTGVARGLSSVGMDPSALNLEIQQYNEEHEYSSRWLPGPEGKSLHIDSVKERVRTVEDLRALMAGTNTANDFFDWNKVIAGLAKNLDTAGAMEVAEIFGNRRRAPWVYAVLSLRLHELGDKIRAWEIGQKAVKASNSMGWHRHFDGGSRLDAFKALLKVDKGKARPRAYKKLSEDLIQHGGWVFVARDLHEILPLLTDDPPLCEIGKEIELYLRTMFETSSLPSVAPPLDVAPNQDTAAVALADLILHYLTHPINVLAQGAQKACLRLILQGDSTLIMAVLPHWDDEGFQERFLPILEAASLQSPSYLQPFREQIIPLAQSPNFAVRMVSRRLCTAAGWQKDQKELKKSPLPAIYGFDLPPPVESSLLGREEVTVYTPLPDDDNPTRTIMPFSVLLNQLASITGLPVQNLIYRAVSLMVQFSPKETWSAAADLDFRAMQQSAGLKFSYMRHRYNLARRAVRHIAAELLDSGTVPREHRHELAHLFRYYDPFLYINSPQPRPDFVVPISGLKQHGSPDKEWLSQVSTADYLKNYYPVADRIILAEHTQLVRLGLDTPTELRLSLVSTLESQIKDLSKDGFITVVNGIISEYPHMAMDEQPLRLVLHHEPLFGAYESPGSGWLALNPALGRELGWRLDEGGFFRWVDRKGQVMVESRWWADGFVGHAPPEENEVGEGWLVLATPTAWDLLKKRFEKLARNTYLKREYSITRKGRSELQTACASNSIVLL